MVSTVLFLPAVLQAAGDQPIVGLAGVERALGANRLIAGALDAQLERPVRARAAVLMLLSGGRRERDLLGRKRLEHPAVDELVDHARLYLPARRGVDVVGARVAAVVVGRA